MRLLLDVHAFLWMLRDDPQLSPHAHDLMAENNVYKFLHQRKLLWEFPGDTLLGYDQTHRQAHATNHLR